MRKVADYSTPSAVSHFDLGSAQKIEVMRSPFSALYGNSSGGVISIFTENGQPGATLEPSASFGSYDMRRIGIKASGEQGGLSYLVDTSTFQTDGYRDHSAAKRDTLNSKLTFHPDDMSKLIFVANAIDMPEAQDTLGLTRSQYDADPRQAGTDALKFNTRKNMTQHQLGFAYDRALTPADTVNSTLYMGKRDTTQFQSIPVSTQAASSSPGGVIDLTRDYWGLDLRWTHRDTFGGKPLRMTVGIDYDTLNEQRKGFQNFIGSGSSQELGIFGALRRDESNRVFNFDQYLQAQWEPGEKWMMLAGVRNSSVKVRSSDHYIVTGNGDDSGSVSYSTIKPVMGVTYRASEALNVYGSCGKGFETPTLNELAYKPGGAGLNFGLRPAKSDHVEVGAKALLSNDVQFKGAVFQVKTQDEIVVLSNTGGRSIYQNVGGTKRNGLELFFNAKFGLGLDFVGAYTWLRAEYAENFRTCVAAPCVLPTKLILAGNSMPGIPHSVLSGELTWKHVPSGLHAGLEVRRVAQVYVDDANSDAAPAYTVANLKLGFEQKLGGWDMKEYLRIDNFEDRRYAGSVIVNEGNSRFFESAPGRNNLIGVNLGYAW